MTDSPYAMTQAEEMVSLHRIYCDCEKCEARKRHALKELEQESCKPSPYFRSPKKAK